MQEVLDAPPSDASFGLGPMWSPSPHNLLWSRLNRFTTQFRWTMTSMRVDMLDADLFEIFEEEARAVPRLGTSPASVDGSVQTMPLPGWRCCVPCTPSKGSARLAGALRLGEMATALKHRPSALVPTSDSALVEPLPDQF